MAEIDIEKKSGGGGKIWLWVIIALIVAGLLYWWFAGDDEGIEEVDTEQVEDETVMADEAGTTTWEDENSVEEEIDSPSEYAAYIGNTEKMGIDHQYTNNALVYLVDTFESEVEESDLDLDAEWQEIREMASRITEDPMAVTHANTIKEVGLKLSNIATRLQEEDSAQYSSEVEEMKKAAQNIQKDVQTLNQKDQIMAFFQESADVLKKMS